MFLNTYAAMLVELSVDGNAIKVHQVFCAVDCGRVINPNGAEAQIEGGIIFVIPPLITEVKSRVLRLYICLR